MGETFAIQIPYAVIMDPNKHLDEVNLQAATICHVKGVHYRPMEKLYALSVNKETGMTRVEGKVETNDGMLDIDDFEMPLRLPTAVFDGEVTHPRHIRLYSIEQCVKNVLDWSTARGIVANGKWFTQVTKFYEEDGEAATGISKTKKRLIMDGLGDALVVLVNILALNYNPDILEIMLKRARTRIATDVPVGDAHRLFHKMRLHFTLMNDAFYQFEDWCERNNVSVADKPKMPQIFGFDIENNMLDALWHMEALARAYEVTLEQCFSLAWDEIKDRKGFLNADGIFIKEADMTAEQKAAQA